MNILTKVTQLKQWIGQKERSQPFTLPDERTYRSHPALAQSTVKYILNGVNEYRKKQNMNFTHTYSRGIAIGSAVDAMLTDTDKLSELNVVPSKVPTGKIAACMKLMLKGISLEEAYKIVDFKRDDIEVVREKIDSDPYYYAMLNIINSKKITIMEADYEVALAVYESMKTHEFTRFYCMDKYPKHMEAHTQLPIVFKYKGFELKALLDKVIVDHKRKTVLPIDFKTSEHVTMNFSKPFRQLKYDIQAYWYTQACKSYFKGYKILPFVFVIESTTHQGCPLVYEVSKKTMKAAKKKVDKALDTYTWHISNETGFSYDKVVIENNGKLVI